MRVEPKVGFTSDEFYELDEKAVTRILDGVCPYCKKLVVSPFQVAEIPGLGVKRINPYFCPHCGTLYLTDVELEVRTIFQDEEDGLKAGMLKSMLEGKTVTIRKEKNDS